MTGYSLKYACTVILSTVHVHSHTGFNPFLTKPQKIIRIFLRSLTPPWQSFVVAIHSREEAIVSTATSSLFFISWRNSRCVLEHNSSSQEVDSGIFTGELHFWQRVRMRTPVAGRSAEDYNRSGAPDPLGLLLHSGKTHIIQHAKSVHCSFQAPQPWSKHTSQEPSRESVVQTRRQPGERSEWIIRTQAELPLQVPLPSIESNGNSWSLIWLELLKRLVDNNQLDVVTCPDFLADACGVILWATNGVINGIAGLLGGHHQR